MPYPRWLAQMNKRLFNPREVKKGKRPVVVHVGRSSGVSHQTPLDAHPTKEGYVLVVRYGPRSDWVQNILASGTCDLRVDGEERALVSPRLASEAEVLERLPDGFEPNPDFYKADHYLLMDQAD